MNEGKILLVNLSKGKLGEERSSFFGTFLTSLIQLATYSREGMKEENRRDFFVYIDEFQNFATHHFVDIFSEARKYHVFFTPSHQTIAQIEDVRIPEVISSNADTIIALKNGPADEEFILPFFTPEVGIGEIVNLPKYHFFMKATGGTEEDGFSGETIPLKQEGDEKTAEEVIMYTRTHYATPKASVEKQIQTLFRIQNNTPEKDTKNVNFASQNSRMKKTNKEKVENTNKDMVNKAKRKKREKEGM